VEESGREAAPEDVGVVDGEQPATRSLWARLKGKGKGKQKAVEATVTEVAPEDP